MRILIITCSLSIIAILTACNLNDSSTLADEILIENKVTPINPSIKTDYGQIGDYQTMDEYYLDENDNKVYHGYRKNLYPTLNPKIVSFYEHGILKWTETYDEAGNVLTSNQ